jgi:hypothetical protein
MEIYLQSGGQGSPIVDIKEAIAGMKEKFEIIGQMFVDSCNGLHQIMTLHFFIYIQSVHTWGIKSCQPHITNND